MYPVSSDSGSEHLAQVQMWAQHPPVQPVGLGVGKSL